MKQGFLDGCFDGYHAGHVHALYQAKLHMGDNKLVVATHTDAEIAKYKSPCLFNYTTRYKMLKHCKFIDQLLDASEYCTSLDTIERNNCDFFLHGDDIILDANGNDILSELKRAGKLVLYPRTEGVSTTDLVYRIDHLMRGEPIPTNGNIDYLKGIFEKITRFEQKRGIFNKITRFEQKRQETQKVVYIELTWDLFNDIHIDYL